MKPHDQTEQDRQARDIFLRAVELASPAARAAYVAEACGTDTALRARVEALLRSHQDDSFLEAGALSEAVTVTLGTPLAEGPGTRIGRYKLLEQIGEGGMGVVYLAEQTEPMPHDADVTVARFNLDGRRIVTVCRDHTIRVWEAQARPPLALRPVVPLRHAKMYWRRPELSRSGRLVVMQTVARRVVVWDALTGAFVASMQHEKRVVIARFSPDATHIVTVSEDGTGRVWDALSGRPLTGPFEIGGPVWAVEFSPDGSQFATASHTEHGPGRSDVLYASRFSQDGLRFLGNWATYRFWDAQTGQPLGDPVPTPGNRTLVLDARTRRVQAELAGADFFGTAQFSPDGLRVATASRTAVQVWDVRTGQQVFAHLVHDRDQADATQVEWVRFSPDGKRLLTGTSFELRVWDAETGHPVTGIIKPGGDVLGKELSPDGRWMVTAQNLRRVITEAPVGTVNVWDSRTGLPVLDPLDHRGYGDMRNAQFSPDGRRIITATDGRARIWDFVPAPVHCPDWLLPVAEALAGKTLNAAGTLEATRLNGLETLYQTRQTLAALPEDDWVSWGRWLLDDHGTRKLSPFAGITVREYVQRAFSQNSVQSLREAIRLDPTNATARAGLALLLEHPEPRKVRPPLAEAEGAARLAVRLAPHADQSWEALGALLLGQDRLVAALGAMEQALRLQPTNAAAWELRGKILERAKRLEEAQAAYSRQVKLESGGGAGASFERQRALLNRARVMRNLDRLEEAAQDVTLALRIPSREAPGEPNTVDLSPFYHAGLKGNWFIHPEEYVYKDDTDLAGILTDWRKRTDNDLSDLPIGMPELAGARFDVRGLIQLRGPEPVGQYPRRVEGIPLPGKTLRVHFLHGAVGGGYDAAGTEIGKYVLHYADGTTAERPIILGKDVLDWFAEPPASAAADGLVVAWTGQNARSRAQGRSIRLYKSTWETPKPDAEVTRMDFVSADKNTAPFLIAVTAESTREPFPFEPAGPVCRFLSGFRKQRQPRG